MGTSNLHNCHLHTDDEHITNKVMTGRMYKKVFNVIWSPPANNIPDNIFAVYEMATSTWVWN